MKVNIKKVVYNLLNKHSTHESVSVNITSKFGFNKENVFDRAFFFEVNLDGEDYEEKVSTRNFILIASCHYEIDQKKFPDLSEKEMEEDNIVFLECLHKLNEIIKNITSQDEITRPLNIDKAIKDTNFQ